MRKKKRYVICLVLIGVMFSIPVAAQSNWAAFWTKFKTAVVKGDKQTVLSLSQGKLSDADYDALFGTKSKKECFAKAKAFKEDPEGAYVVFCGELGYYFEKIDGQYKFTEAFPDD